MAIDVIARMRIAVVMVVDLTSVNVVTMKEHAKLHVSYVLSAVPSVVELKIFRPCRPLSGHKLSSIYQNKTE